MEIATINRTAYHIGNVIDASVTLAQEEMKVAWFDPDLSKARRVQV
jgi:hypothetical protein